MQDDDARSSSSVALLREVVAHMRENGVRRVWLARGPLELEVELDPASQFLGDKGEGAPSEEEASKQREEKRAKGLCVSGNCDKPGGHMGTPHCRQHFLTELNGTET